MNGSDPVDRLRRSKLPSQMACVSEELKCEELETLPAGTVPRTSHYRSPGGENGGHRKRSTIFRERMWESQSHEHSDCFKGNVGETAERRCGAHMGFLEHVDTI